MVAVKFAVLGNPVPQGSMKSFGPGRLVASNREKLMPWRDHISYEAQAAVTEIGVPELFPLSGPVRVHLRFELHRPKSAPKERRYPSNRSGGDLDKLVRAVLDAITGILVADDSQVVDLTARKDYGTPGAWVTVWEVT